MSKTQQQHRPLGHSISQTSRIIVGGLLASTLLVGGFMLAPKPASAADITVYKSPTCGCCTKWVKHLEDNGFSVQVKHRRDLTAVKQELGVKRELQGCHTGVVEGYVIEGHVPAADIQRLLTERPNVRGLSVPGMPMGSPGMEGPRKSPYKVLSFDEQGNTSTYNSY